MLRFENEEFEIQNDTLKRDIAAQDDKIEEAYCETRHFKEQLKIGDTEKGGLIQSLEDKNLQIVGLEKELLKSKQKYRDLDKVNTELEENVTMLEYTLESRDQKIYDLEEDIKIFEEKGSASSSISLDNCEKTTNLEDNSKDHDTFKHSDENLPTTSKCGQCEYQSEDEDSLNEHMQEHVLECDLCDFKTESRRDKDTHELFEHNNPCPECLQIFRTYDKLEKHTCKLEVRNPAFQTYYTRSWVDGNACNSVFCNILGKEVAILHIEKCLTNKKCCCWAPYDLARKISETVHLEFDKFAKEEKMRYRDILWSELVKEINK